MKGKKLAVKTLYHNLDGDSDNYVVDMMFHDVLSTPSYGINNIGIGINVYDNKNVGANWENLTNQDIKVFRAHNDTYVDSVRVRIWVYK